MEFLEKDLEEIIYNASNDKLEEKGLYLNGKKIKQLPLKSGRADILVCSKYSSYHTGFKNSYIHFDILELKKGKIGISAFLQAIRYADNLKVYLDDNKPNLKYNISITLIGSKIDDSGSFCYLSNLMEYDPLFEPQNNLIGLRFYTYKIGIDGIEFKYEKMNSSEADYYDEEDMIEESIIQKPQYDLFTNEDEFSVEEAAKTLNVTKRTIQRKLKKMRTPVYKGAYVITKDVLNKITEDTLKRNRDLIFNVEESAIILNKSERSIQDYCRKFNVKKLFNKYSITYDNLIEWGVNSKTIDKYLLDYNREI